MKEVSRQRSGVRKSLYYCILSWILLLALSVPADAQDTKKIPRIGFLAVLARVLATEQAFLQGLRDLGYIDGQNITIDYRFAAAR